MDIIQFLLSVINLILALVVLFGGRFFLSKISELQIQIDTLKHAQSLQQVSNGQSIKPTTAQTFQQAAAQPYQQIPTQPFPVSPVEAEKAKSPEWNE